MNKSISYSEKLPNSSEYMRLFNTTGWNEANSTDENKLITTLKNSWYFVAVYCDNKLVGSGRIVSDGILYAMIYDLIVEPSYQGMGIGSTILSKLINKCKSEEVKEIQLFSAKSKVPYYIKRGFIKRPDDAPGMKYIN